MSFRLVPKSVTLNDLERRNCRYFCVISPNSVPFEAHYSQADYVTLVEDRPIVSAKYRIPVIWHSPFASENLTNNQP